MSGAHPIYHTLVRLYPKAFRDAYGDDVVQHFDDLVADRGIRAAWGRTALDLAVTIPRYRLETIMNERHSATTISVAVGLLAAAGVASMLVGLYSGCAAGRRRPRARHRPAQRHRSRTSSPRPPSSTPPTADRRRPRSRVRCFVRRLPDADRRHVVDTRDTVLAIIGNAAMIGAVGFLAAALLTPKTPQRHQHNEAT